MNEYNVSDYQIFINAISTSKAFTTKINAAQEIIKSSEQIINDNSKFMGPVQENCVENFANVNSKVSIMLQNMAKIEEFLTNASANYQKGDQDAEKTVTSVSDTATATSTEISQKRKEFIGDVNDTSKYFIDPKYPNMSKDLRCFDNLTGEELTDNSTIKMKVGETRVLTVAVPYNAGAVKQIIRTTAADISSAKDTYKITSSKSDINPDPNVVDYVNYQSQSNHWPEGVDLHTNYYDWIITADKAGKRQISQTCEYKSTAGTPKSMIGINVEITE